MVNITILDDNKNVCGTIKRYLENISVPEPLNIFTTDNVEALLEYSLKNKIDIAYFDVDLGNKKTGMEIADEIKINNINTLVIFISSYNSYYEELVRHESFCFLLKPFKRDEFGNVFNRAYKRILSIRSNHGDTLFEYRFNRENKKVKIDDIIYFLSGNRGIFIGIKDCREDFFYGRKIDDILIEMERLSPEVFVQINKKTIINTRYIKVYSKREVEMIDKNIFKIDPTYRKNEAS